VFVSPWWTNHPRWS